MWLTKNIFCLPPPPPPWENPGYTPAYKFRNLVDCLNVILCPLNFE